MDKPRGRPRKAPKPAQAARAVGGADVDSRSVSISNQHFLFLYSKLADDEYAWTIRRLGGGLKRRRDVDVSSSISKFFFSYSL